VVNHHLGSCCPSEWKTWAKKRSARANPVDFKEIRTVPSAKINTHLNCLGRSADTQQTSTEHPLRATQHGSQWCWQAVCAHTQPRPAGLRAEAPPRGKRRSVEERLRPRPKAGEPRQSQGQHSRPRELQGQGHMVQSLGEGPPGIWAENGSSRGPSDIWLSDGGWSAKEAQPGAAARPGVVQRTAGGRGTGVGKQARA